MCGADAGGQGLIQEGGLVIHGVGDSARKEPERGKQDGLEQSEAERQAQDVLEAEEEGEPKIFLSSSFSLLSFSFSSPSLPSSPFFLFLFLSGVQCGRA